MPNPLGLTLPDPTTRLTPRAPAAILTTQPRWSLGRGNTLVPSSWQATPGEPPGLHR